jgi:tetratricopeptide (TPR) repeat protein
MCSFSCLSLAQSSNTKKQVQFVFDKLISVYGSAKSAPKCLVIKKAKFPVLPASYSTKNGPTIQIDEALYKVCQTFGKDSLNALAIVMSHELTHYYNDHTFCSDYAFANFKSNTPLKSKIGQASSSARIEKESEADIKGFFYAAAAGFEPHGLQGLLIGKIYTAYKLSDEQKGYPTKKERIAIANNAEKIAAQLYEYFKNGLIAIENKRYDEAIELFTKANSQVPFRENWNNIGIANTRKALILKENSEDEKLFSQKFLYPLEVENKSRLNKDVTRSLDDNSDEMLQLLKVAQKDFQEAIRLDPNFTKGYINLACVYDLLGNPNAAIGTIKDLKPIEQQKSTDAQRILAIAYFHDKQENKANDIWNELKI